MKINRRFLTSRSGQFILFKYTVYSFLAFNIYLYALNGSFTETIDTAAWVVLLGVFEWETHSSLSLSSDYSGWTEKWILGILGTAAYLVILYSAYCYYEEAEWLDVANSVTWLLVILALQYDVYFPGNFHKTEWAIRNWTKAILYTALLVFAIMWGMQGEVLDFYDAFLWMLSFVVIEMNVFNFEHRFIEEDHREE